MDTTRCRRLRSCVPSSSLPKPARVRYYSVGWSRIETPPMDQSRPTGGVPTTTPLDGLSVERQHFISLGCCHASHQVEPSMTFGVFSTTALQRVQPHASSVLYSAAELLFRCQQRLCVVQWGFCLPTNKARESCSRRTASGLMYVRKRFGVNHGDMSTWVTVP